MTKSNILRLDNVNVAYGEKVACKEISLQIAQGELYALVGPNGAGKSSLIGAITSQLRVRNGSISICGEPSSSKTAKQKLGLAPQQPALFEKLTAEENAVTFMELWNASKDKIQTRNDARNAIATFGLDPDNKRYVSSYSGGMKQRLNLAIATAHKPKLLILDEPTANLDPQGDTIVTDALQTFLETGSAILLVTHDLKQAQILAARVGVMKQGLLLSLIHI